MLSNRISQRLGYRKVPLINLSKFVFRHPVGGALHPDVELIFLKELVGFIYQLPVVQVNEHLFAQV